jgi:hypothetical protein
LGALAAPQPSGEITLAPAARPWASGLERGRRGKGGALFNHLVGAAEQHRRHVGAERLRGLEISNLFELGTLLNQKALALPSCYISLNR